MIKKFQIVHDMMTSKIALNVISIFILKKVLARRSSMEKRTINFNVALVWRDITWKHQSVKRWKYRIAKWWIVTLKNVWFVNLDIFKTEKKTALKILFWHQFLNLIVGYLEHPPWLYNWCFLSHFLIDWI